MSIRSVATYHAKKNLRGKAPPGRPPKIKTPDKKRITVKPRKR